MGTIDTPALDADLFHRNLSALRTVEPELAARLEHALERVGELSAPAATRDGRVSFRVRRPDGTPGWFGRTSIPGVRAAALLEQFQPGNANVLLPGVGEGSEAALLTQRLGRHRAVFVWEECETSVCWSLHLHDFESAILDKRLVFLLCAAGDLAAALSEWLRKNPGHLCPDRIMMWPWLTFGEIVPCRAAVEAAYQRVEQERSRALATLRRESAEAPRAVSASSAPVIALLGLHARDETILLADSLAAGAESLGWRPVSAVVRSPADVHPLARARRLHNDPNGRPEMAILIDITRHEVRDVLPDSVPAVCWLDPGAALDASLPARMGADDVIAVTGSWVRDRAIAGGIDARRIHVCPPPCLTVGKDFDPADDRPIDVAIVADLGPTDAASFGHRLPTHEQIWKAAVDLLKARIEEFFSEDLCDALLTRTEERLGAWIEDEATRAAMLRALGMNVAPVLLWQFLAQSLIQNEVNVSLHGGGWASFDPSDCRDPGAVTVLRRLEIVRRAKLVVHADLTGAMTADALIAAGAGAVVLARRTPRNDQAGGLGTLLAEESEIVFFSSARELLERVRQLLSDEPARRRIAQTAIRRCASDHAPAARLQTLRAMLTS